MLKKVKTETGVYSEVFFNTNRGMGIGRLIVDPMRGLMYSTKASDNEQIEFYTRKNVELDQAMIQVAADNKQMRYEMVRPSFLDYDRKLVELEEDINKYLNTNEIEEEKILNAQDEVVISDRSFNSKASLVTVDDEMKLKEAVNG